MIKLAIFDMDGTLFESRLDWKKIKEELNVKEEESILRTIYKDNKVDQARLDILERYEEENTLNTKPIAGVSDFMDFLKIHRIKAALVTNNTRKNCEFLLKKFNLVFDSVVSREMKLWKPLPDPLLYVMALFGCKKQETISIGDSLYDVKASRQAEIGDIFIIRSEKSIAFRDDGITLFGDYFELKNILERRYITIF